MKKLHWVFVLLTLSLIAFSLPGRAAGAWVPLAHPPPGPAGHFLLLPDGSVMAENLSTNYGPGWFRFIPDSHGSYANGTWTNTAPMAYTRLDFDSLVLTNGKVLVAGGEYGSGPGTAEIYDPAANTWTTVNPPTSVLNPAATSPQTGNAQGFLDSAAVVLANGQVLVAPVAPNTAGGMVMFSPGANTWSLGPTTFATSYPFLYEASWVQLVDGSVVVVDSGTTTSERYLPASNQWVRDASVPVSLYDSFGGEEGPGLLLPNGKAIFFGATSNTAIYTPSGNNNPGTWSAGPNFPNGQGMPDAPAAMMVNGKILCLTAQAPTNSDVWYPPCSFFEYDYVSNTFTRVASPQGGNTFNDVAWPTLMCDLPDGTVLFGHRNTDFYIYQPDGVPITAGKPTISSITTNANGSLHITGKLFNGISAGASYGDDEQMDGNWPVVRFTDANGIVRYGRTYNWSGSGVMTGSATVSTECVMPPGASLNDNVQVVVNGFESGYNPIVENTNDSGPGSLRQLVQTLPSGLTITFAASLSGQTILLTSGELLLTNNVTIDGSSLPSPVRLNGNHNSRIFNVAGSVNVTLNSLVLTNSYPGAGNWGGAIINGGTLTINNCTMTGNSVDSSSSGGAIQNGGTLTIAGCTFDGNSAAFAGAINNNSVCSAQNCTFYENVASAGNGGAFDNAYSATLSILHCTLYGNTASSLGGAIDNYLSWVNLTNSIVAGNSSDDIYNWSASTNTDGGSNIVQILDNAGTLAGADTIFAINPLLGPLANNGGPTLTLLPQIGSPAIDAGVSSDAASLAADQRGFPRLVGDAVDIGAVEASAVPYVFNSNDSGYGSLRYAVTYAPKNSTITFSNALSGQAILLTGGVIALNNNVIIDAAALSNRVAINGNHTSQAFSVEGGVNAVLNFLTITNCFNSSFGGGIVSYGNLALNNCQLVNNQSTGTAGALAAGFGSLSLNQTTVSGNVCVNCSAIYVQDEPVTISNCTISGNHGANGDAVRLNGASVNSTLTVINSTFSGNTVSSGVASALTIQSSSGVSASAMLTNCTVSDNAASSAGQPGAIYLQPGGGTNTIGLYNTIVSGNTAGGMESDITGTADSGSAYNLIGAGGGLVNGMNGNQVGVNNPQLAALGNYGGPTLTMPPLLGSPALNAGLNSLAAGLTYDQRGAGYPRIVGAAVDIGAVEAQLFNSPIRSTLTGVTRSGSGTVSFSFTNLTGASFSVWASTNVALPFSDWSNLGAPSESPAGTFQFTDMHAANYPQRFYRVRSP